MRDRDLYATILGLTAPWKVTDVEVDAQLETVAVRVSAAGKSAFLECEQHGVRQVEVPWGEPGSGFTALFESLIIDWLKETTTTAVARRLAPTWDEVDGIMRRAVVRGLDSGSDFRRSRAG